MHLLTDPTVWAAFATLTVMEIVLGIDNVIFISVLVSKLPPEQAKRARQIGLALALIFRLVFLFLLAWIMALTTPVFTAFGHGFSWRDLILIAGGGFLVFKAVKEIHGEVDPEDDHGPGAVEATFTAAVTQIVIIDLIFSIDSIITAVGMARDIEVMVAAVIVAVGVMYVASGPVARFVDENPTTKMLALAFLILIGVTLVADGFGQHVPKGYIYAAMAFSVVVETLNVWAKRRKAKAGLDLMSAPPRGARHRVAAGEAAERPAATP
jgi:predicted tellurium resistance membrane protein TerC